MGRRKIEIKFINDDRNRSVTFIKRKNGLFKKAHELSILTGAKVTVHVEDIKERRFDYVSANLGGEHALQQFPSDDEDDDGQSNDGHEDLHEADLHESASSVGSTSAPGSKRDSGVLRPTHRRSQSSVHLSPNPNVPSSRRSSGHPYPRSPNTAPSTSVGLARPASMDLGMAGFATQTSPAGGPQRKYSAPSIPVIQQQQQQQQQQHFGLQSDIGPSHYLQQQQPSGAQFYFHPNQSHPAHNTFERAYGQIQQQQQQQQAPLQMPRYNGNLFQANGHPATHSQQHIPAYPSNLAPSVNRPHSNTLPSSKEDSTFGDFGGSLEEYMDDDIDGDYDVMGTQASTPANYDFSTNPSLTNLNMTATSSKQQGRTVGLGFGLAAGGAGGGGGGAYGNTSASYQGHQQQQGYLQQQQHPQQQQQQLQRGQAQQHQLHPVQQGMGFYNNPSGAQSTPNLAWTMSPQLQMQMSPPRR